MINNYAKILNEAGIRPSIQRLAVYQYLCEKMNHPDVETVYSELAPSYPTLSRTTVYNTLKLFEEKNIVQSLKIDDDKLRYDAEMRDHAHFKCEKCGLILDLHTNNENPDIKTKCQNILPRGFSLNKFQTTIWGTCIDCN